MVIAHTVKGKGISFAENVTKWHHHVPSKEEYELAMGELSKQLEVLRNEIVALKIVVKIKLLIDKLSVIHC